MGSEGHFTHDIQKDAASDAELEDLFNFLRELRHETDRGLALVSAAVIDENLAQILGAFFQDDREAAQRILGVDPRREAALSSFSARADAAFALGLIERQEYDEIGLIRRIRNEFAHARHGLRFDTSDIAKLCLKLKAGPPPRATEPTPRLRFHFSVVSTYLRLYGRPRHVLRERRQPKEWMPPDQLVWSTSPNYDAVTLTFDNGETLTVDFGQPTTATFGNRR